ncbi:MAG: lysophospholipid acyltransferase family protein [Rhodoglobus sp.]|uniref:lysophospholipid acyltransferase family protein n=1 Tax=Salinibacterium sp. G-O1 TaxID=3046208 RepID=UPI0024BAC8CF|nr:lysophospholipid acyltransferase family protein [Salinibacterium sp. G-O1]MDJ0335766.1 lysophospholipid acyltransferase family protein [Salinibacterium sp. G-O1]
MTRGTSSTTRPAKRKSEKTAIFRFFATALIPLMNLLARYRVRGLENVPETGSFVVAPNHYSNVDPIVIGIGLWKSGRMPRYFAKASLFRNPIVGALLMKAEQIPVERSGASRDGVGPLKQAQEIAAAGHAVVIYPEGSLTRDPDSWPMRGKFGAVRTALDAGIPLIPAASWGAQLIMPQKTNRISFFPRKNVDIVFGTPVDLSEFADRPRDSRVLAEATAKLMAAITSLVEELRGETAPAERWNPADHGQTETGRFHDKH